jgi:opine dehydrogenase
MGERIAVLGAGNGGYALASDLALSGYKVNLFELERFREFNLNPIGMFLHLISRKRLREPK